MLQLSNAFLFKATRLLWVTTHASPRVSSVSVSACKQPISAMSSKWLPLALNVSPTSGERGSVRWAFPG